MRETTTSEALLARLEALSARLDEQAAEIAELKTENARLTAVRPSGAFTAPEPSGGTVGPSGARQQGGRGPVRVGILKRRGLLAGAAALVGVGLAKLGPIEQAEAGHTSLNNPELLHIGVLNDGGNAADDESASNLTTTTVLVGNVNLAPVLRVRQLNPLDDALEAIGGFSGAGSDPGTGLVGIGGARTDVVFTGNGGLASMAGAAMLKWASPANEAERGYGAPVGGHDLALASRDAATGRAEIRVTESSGARTPTRARESVPSTLEAVRASRASRTPASAC